MASASAAVVVLVAVGRYNTGMDISALVIDFSGVLMSANADVPSIEHLKHEAATPPSGYRFLEHFKLNTELLEYLRSLSQRVPVYLFTDGNLHKRPEVEAALQGVFKGMFQAQEFGFNKTQDEAYLALAYRIGAVPAYILFIDDSPANLAAAASAGLVTYQYTTNAALIHYLESAK